MARAILTGFDVFGGYDFNPVKDAAQEFNGKKISGVEIKGLVLPSRYHAFDVLYREIRDYRPDLVLSMGFASRIPCLRLETRGKNEMFSRYADADGIRPESSVQIVAGGNEFYENRSIDSSELVALLKGNSLPAEVSIDADTFICNSLIYCTLRWIEINHSPMRFLFLHTPATEDYSGKPGIEGKPKIPKEMLYKGINLLIESMAK
ncbi:MAG: hypothetical protein KKE20_04720 [Nanoarchaeota archaeon]|nr:hypothetical protein [Nanoarchaeota archaeon]